MTQPRPLGRIVIVGGGTAGWMTAAVLARLVPGGTSVTLVESDAIGTVGVGEATLPSLSDLHRLLGIQEDAFIRATGATFKLGIEFAGWGAAGTRYFHPFGTYGRDAAGLPFHQLWLRKLAQDGPAAAGGIEDYCLSAVAAREGRFTRPAGEANAVLASLRYAFHLDAGLYAAFLRQYAEGGGVRRVEGRIREVALAPDTGCIDAVVLDDERQVAGDFFVDCSGFRSLLLGGALGVPFVSWQHWLPCDRALAVPSAVAGAAHPFTRSTTTGAGWRWRIPLQHRVGNGHVYASAFTDDGAAADALLAGLDSPATAEPRPIRFTAGVRERLWERNCVAVGLAGGFLEPLESTGIHLIQSGITRLMSLLPDSGHDPAGRAQYNRLLREEYEQARDFVLLHYIAAGRQDTPFWRHCRATTPPDTLAHAIELWRGRGRVMPPAGHLFTPPSWVAVLLGQAGPPQSYDLQADLLPAAELARFLAHLRDVIGRTAAAMPDHGAFIARNCAAAGAARTIAA
ncbi:tryptophan halogenase family protein (plasmid) [Croceibacterium sp. TMG7-5b_MA50]|uniref:tryptophan halogenase family protein n=1 Tax=Croceibacterium sp. TMG7-5b_MA50 TaxID=3121290 RepID=UPI003221C0DE